MNLKLEVLATKSIQHKTWYLCKGNLLDYLNSLKGDFYDFAIQRRIVKNQYLDILYETILSGDPIPVITLTYKEKLAGNIKKTSEEFNINMESIEILDGLQRTFRLWAYKKVHDCFTENDGFSASDLAKKIKSENPLFFETGVISTTLIKELIGTGEINKISTVYSTFDVYFVIWQGLKEYEIIQKMLVLNAGQKAVSKTHQFELLFLHFYEDIIKTQSKIKLIKEREENSNNIKKGNRDVGQFMFSSIIVALQSFVEQKPLRISTEGLFNELEPDVEIKNTVYNSVFSSEFIKLYLEELYLLDESVTLKETELGKEWFVKDTTLSGVFAAIGRHIKIEESWSEKDLAKFAKIGFKDLRDAITSKGLMLSQFTDQYNNMSGRGVNIGNFIRKVVMEYVYELLENSQPNWAEIFERVKKGGK